MLISEIFHSIQGEGSLAGVPSIFIRTSGCNLRCVWCDTPYASWNPTGEEMSVGQIIEKISHFPASHVVLTGGEPMIAKEIHILAAELKALGMHITIETAATVMPGGISCNLASLSPKLAHSTPSLDIAGPWSDRHEKNRWQPEVIRAWIECGDYQLKFVVKGGDDVNEIIRSLENNRIEVPAHKILLMPEGVDLPTLRDSASRVADLCKIHGFRYTPRLHIDLYGNTRGT